MGAPLAPPLPSDECTSSSTPAIPCLTHCLKASQEEELASLRHERDKASPIPFHSFCCLPIPFPPRLHLSHPVLFCPNKGSTVISVPVLPHSQHLVMCIHLQDLHPLVCTCHCVRLQAVALRTVAEMEVKSGCRKQCNTSKTRFRAPNPAPHTCYTAHRACRAGIHHASQPCLFAIACSSRHPNFSTLSKQAFYALTQLLCCVGCDLQGRPPEATGSSRAPLRAPLCAPLRAPLRTPLRAPLCALICTPWRAPLLVPPNPAMLLPCVGNHVLPSHPFVLNLPQKHYS